MTVTFVPVRQSPDILELFLSRMDGEVWVYDDNTDPESSALLRDADVRVLAPVNNLPPASSGRHNWNDQTVSRVAQIKNYAIGRFLETDDDFLFLVDSDVIIQDHTIPHLRASQDPVLSLVYWSQWETGGPWLPNVWDEGHDQFRELDSLARLRDPGHYQVGGLGAATLIRRDVLEQVRFDPVPNFPMWGEDRWFCMRAGVHGIPLQACTHMTPFHVYRDEQLPDAVGWDHARAERWVDDNLGELWLRSLKG